MLRGVMLSIIPIAEKHRRIKRELRLIVRALRSIKRRALADFLEGGMAFGDTWATPTRTKYGYTLHTNAVFCTMCY